MVSWNAGIQRKCCRRVWGGGGGQCNGLWFLLSPEIRWHPTADLHLKITLQLNSTKRMDCVCVYMHISMCLCVLCLYILFVRLCMCVHVYMNACMCMHMCATIYVLVCLHVGKYVFVCVSICICMFKSTCLCMSVYTCVDFMCLALS